MWYWFFFFLFRTAPCDTDCFSFVLVLEFVYILFIKLMRLVSSVLDPDTNYLKKRRWCKWNFFYEEKWTWNNLHIQEVKWNFNKREIVYPNSEILNLVLEFLYNSIEFNLKDIMWPSTWEKKPYWIILWSYGRVCTTFDDGTFQPRTRMSCLCSGIRGCLCCHPEGWWPRFKHGRNFPNYKLARYRCFEI